MLLDFTKDLKNGVDKFIHDQFNQRALELCGNKNIALSDKEWLLNYFIETRAMNRATIMRERIQNPNGLMMQSRNKIVKYFEGRLPEISNITSQKDFDEWHDSICTNISENGMRYGLWQKLINISMKYIYCVKDIFPEYSNALQFCHCPIDSQIAASIKSYLEKLQIGNEYILGLVSDIEHHKVRNWNRLNADDYKLLQDAVHDICTSGEFIADGHTISNLEFDIVSWNN